jgi:cell wall-associated NlpC family hydrolase
MISTITAIAAAMMFAAAVLWAAFPWAITVNGKEVCYFETHDDAVAVIDRIVAKNSLKYANALAMDMSSIGIVKAPVFDVEYSDTKAAATLISEQYLKSNKAAIKVTSIKTEKSRYTPDTEFVKDEKMLAGQSEIEQQPKEGLKREKIRYTTENGKIVEREVLESEILKEGTPKIIRKGVIGLPEGENWKTYEGLPAFNDGSDMIKDAKNYLGLRYIWGGYNLNKGVDCVGFVTEMYKKFGIYLPRSHSGLRKAGVSVPSISQAKAGDIICYNGHVALYMGNGKVIHATRGKSNNVHISKVNYNKKRHIITIRRVVQ